MAPGTGVQAEVSLTPPHGLQEILNVFGNIYQYIGQDGRLDPRWQADFLARIELPFAMALAWDPKTTVQYMTCHKRLAAIFGEVFERIAEAGLRNKLQSFGGCFAYRPQRGGTKLSTHAWGIAVDLNPGSNAQGGVGDMDAGVVETFEAAGFEWGGKWPGPRRDAMHFQYCSGY